MLEFFKDGGWGMYPVLVFGTIAIIAALRHAVAPAGRFVPLIVGFCAVTLIAGVLGTAVGVQTTIVYVNREATTDHWLLALGLRESLNNLVMACTAASIAALISTYGSFRRAARDELRGRAEAAS